MSARREGNPEREVEVWAFGEHRVGLEPVLRRQWAPQGRRPVAQGQHRYEWLYLYAFVRPSTGEVVWFVCTTVDADLFSAVLAGAGGEAVVAAGRPKAELCLGEFARGMGDAPFVAGGERLSLADLYLVPVVHYLLTTPDKGILERQPALARWWRAMNERASVSGTAPQLG